LRELLSHHPLEERSDAGGDRGNGRQISSSSSIIEKAKLVCRRLRLLSTGEKEDGSSRLVLSVPCVPRDGQVQIFSGVRSIVVVNTNKISSSNSSSSTAATTTMATTSRSSRSSSNASSQQCVVKPLLIHIFRGMSKKAARRGRFKLIVAAMNPEDGTRFAKAEVPTRDDCDIIAGHLDLSGL